MAEALLTGLRLAFVGFLGGRCAFCPPLPATTEPIFGALRVSSTGATAPSYCRPALAPGSALDAVTWRSAPGRAFSLVLDELSNQPQPPSSATLAATAIDLCIAIIAV